MKRGIGLLPRIQSHLKLILTLSTLSTLALLPAACHRSPKDSSDPTAITNRPQSYDRFIAILKLKTPALLSGAPRVNGVAVIDQDRKAALEAEQDAMIAELAALSPQIQVLYRYKLVLNGIAVVAPKELESHFKSLASVSYVEREQKFERLETVVNDDPSAGNVDLSVNNSVSFIGADRVHNELGLTGRGIRVGVIDTGIDYTHAMFGGAGTEAAYQNNDPALVEDSSFPTAKVIGGIDLVGTDYDSNAPDFSRHLPIADADPLDEGGHGSHVAGTIAGAGDNVLSYSGVAPDAKLYAIKVFGKEGSTGDAVIIASLEYAANPAGDLNLQDHLDVINMSLGSSFGMPHILYSEALKNLIDAGTIAAVSAGNSGHSSYIVGAPSTTNEALSVAASIDGMDHNWKFSAVAFTTPTNPQILAEAIEAGFSKPIAEAGAISGKLVHIGLAASDLSDEQKAALRGHVALIDRGTVPFVDKVRRAQDAGAIGVVVANNVDGSASAMGGDGDFAIPAIMISKALGDALKAEMPAGDVTIAFQTDAKIEKPELIDTLTDFSSRGPRSIDGAIKPEIAAPGYNVISAKMGSGNGSVRFNGTSMAAPHIAGVMALLKQQHPDFSSSDLKSLLVNTAKTIDDAQGLIYPVAQQGAGRVEAFAAASAKVLATPATLSLGEVALESAKVVRKTLSLSNITDAPVTVKLVPALDAGITITGPASVTLPAKASREVVLKIKLQAPASTDASLELDGFLKLEVDGSVQGQVPVLAVVNRVARIAASQLKVMATSEADAAGADAELTLVNRGQTAGDALIFNLLGRDQRKEAARENSTRNGVCDVESAGYRIIKKDIEGVSTDLLQVAVKLYNPVTSWHVCEISIQLDKNGDGVADQELLGTYLQTLTNNAAHAGLFASALTDGNIMREIRRTYELGFPNAADPVYTTAILDTQDFVGYGHSTLAVVSANLDQLAKTASGDLAIKVAALTSDVTSPEADDYLDKQATKWKTVNLATANTAFTNIPEVVSLAAGETKVVELTKGGAKGGVIVYLPHNQSNDSQTTRDAQSVSLNPKFVFGH